MSTIARQIWRLLGQEEWVHEPTKFKICGQICGFLHRRMTVYTSQAEIWCGKGRHEFSLKRQIWPRLVMTWSGYTSNSNFGLICGLFGMGLGTPDIWTYLQFLILRG